MNCCLCLCVLVLQLKAELSQSLPRFSPCYSWDGLHPPLEPEVEKQKKQIFWHIYASLLSPVDDNYCAEERFHTHNITDWQTVNAVHAA